MALTSSALAQRKGVVSWERGGVRKGGNEGVRKVKKQKPGEASSKVLAYRSTKCGGGMGGGGVRKAREVENVDLWKGCLINMIWGALGDLHDCVKNLPINPKDSCEKGPRPPAGKGT